MLLLAIDPGNTYSAWMFYDTDKKKWLSSSAEGSHKGKDKNEFVGKLVEKGEYDKLVIEMVNNQGGMVGDTTFNTVFWIGRFVEKADSRGKPFELIKRSKVCSLLKIKGRKSSDSKIRKKMIDVYGSEETKELKYDVWQVLGLIEAHGTLRETDK